MHFNSLAEWGNDIRNWFNCHKVVAWLFGALCTLSDLILYLLLLNEHKEAWGYLWQISSIFTLHTPPCFLFFFLRYFSCDSQKTKSITHLALGFYTYRKKTIFWIMMPAEPGALIKYTKTQICTFCQSGGDFPTETMDWVFQNLNLKHKNKLKTLLYLTSTHFTV